MGQLLVSVNGDSVWHEHIVAAGSVVTLAAVAPQGFSTCEWEMVSNSSRDVLDPVFTIISLGVATFPCMTNPGDGRGRGYRMRCVIDRGKLSESKFTFIVGFLGSLGVIPYCWGEAYERDPIYGWTVLLQSIVANSGALDTSKLPLDGSVAMAAPLPFGNHPGVNCADPTNPQDVVNLRTMQAALANLSMDDIKPGFGLLSFAVSGTNYAQVVEVGTIMSALRADMTYVSGPPSAAGITDTMSGTWFTVSPGYASGTRSGTITSSTNNASCTFTLSATGPVGVKTAAVTTYWQPKVYHGPAYPGTYNAAFITALPSNLQASLAVEFTDVMGAGQYDYFAAPETYGTPLFEYGVLPGGWSLVASHVAVTSNGVTEYYNLWKTDQPNLGSTKWTVTVVPS